MPIPYGRSKLRLYIEIFLLISLKKVFDTYTNSSNKDDANTVDVFMDVNSKEKNIIRFNFQQQKVFFQEVSNQIILNFLHNNIGLLRDENFITCKVECYIFETKYNSCQRRAKFANNKLRQFLDGERLTRDDISYIFTELNNAGIINKKTEEFFSSPININLENLNYSSIKQYINKICRPGGKLDNYLLTNKEGKRLRLNPMIKEKMKSTINLIFGCYIQAWQENEWSIFEREWINNYIDLELSSFPPQRRYVQRIFEDDCITEPNVELVFCVYRLLEKMVNIQLFD